MREKICIVAEYYAEIDTEKNNRGRKRICWINDLRKWYKYSSIVWSCDIKSEMISNHHDDSQPSKRRWHLKKSPAHMGNKQTNTVARSWLLITPKRHIRNSFSQKTHRSSGYSSDVPL